MCRLFYIFHQQTRCFPHSRDVWWERVALCYYISFHMEVTPFVLTKSTRMKLSSVCFSPGADNASVTQHPLSSLRERFNLCFFISLGARLLTCSVHDWFNEGKPLMHSRLLRQASSLTPPLENCFLKLAARLTVESRVFAQITRSLHTFHQVHYFSLSL